MGKIWVEICLISARGLTRTSSLWKLQWFAVGWIDPNNKYCTKVDASGNANPKWKTKFSALVDNSDSKCDDLALNVEVYSRDPVFLKERLQGTASVGLKEFLDKHKNNSEESRHVEEVGSFQLRKNNSNKPQGFVDVSVQISQETDEGNSYEGDEVGIKLKIRDHSVDLGSQIGIRDHSVDLGSQIGHSENHLHPTYPTMNMIPPGQPIYYHQPRAPVPLNYPLPGGSNHQPSHAPSIRPNYHQPQTQPPPQPQPQPQYNVGYMPPSSIGNLPASYISMPSSSGPRSGPRDGHGFAMGLGVGALAAGAAIFGEDFVTGFDLPTSFTISTDPPF